MITKEYGNEVMLNGYEKFVATEDEIVVYVEDNIPIVITKNEVVDWDEFDLAMLFQNLQKDKSPEAKAIMAKAEELFGEIPTLETLAEREKGIVPETCRICPFRSENKCGFCNGTRQYCYDHPCLDEKHERAEVLKILDVEASTKGADAKLFNQKIAAVKLYPEAEEFTTADVFMLLSAKTAQEAIEVMDDVMDFNRRLNA